MSDLGPLAAALAKAQSEFPPIHREKQVTVTSKRTGSSYTFKYAPLDYILDKVQEPLARNGLALAQLLDDGALVTMLMHESGAVISGRIDLPAAEDIQGLGSAITYLRRYAIQAALGIAAEEDDDGNRSIGNQVRADVERSDDGSLIGTVEVGDRTSSDFELRNEPDGPVLGFRLRGQRGGILVRATGALAVALFERRESIIGARVTCWGRVAEESFTPRGKKQAVTYQVLAADRVSIPDVGVLPAGNEEQSSITEAESEAIWSAMESGAIG